MKVFSLLFGIFCYLLFLGVFAYMVGFVGDFLVPKSVSQGAGPLSLSPTLTNLLLILLWGIQHSVMARSEFKQYLANWLPAPLERSFYVLASSIILIVVMWFWQPQPATLWVVTNPTLVSVVWVLFGLGWAIALYSTFLTSHLDLFGLRQCYLQLKDRDYTPVPFIEKSLYRWVRHPMMLGLLIAFWATPHMTVSHLIFAIGMTAYTIIGIYFEEASLAKRLGKPYKDYQLRTARLIPILY